VSWSESVDWWLEEIESDPTYEPARGPGVYDEAKRFAEALTLAYNREHGLDTRIDGIFNTYAPRMRPTDGRAVPAFFKSALANEPLPIFWGREPNAIALLCRRRGRGHPPVVAFR
jgi:nucleoside-diphosphate-sugar epimerase